jgi:hypothetical protein
VTVVEQVGHQPWRDVQEWSIEELRWKAAAHVELYKRIRGVEDEA